MSDGRTPPKPDADRPALEVARQNLEFAQEQHRMAQVHAETYADLKARHHFTNNDDYTLICEEADRRARIAAGWESRVAEAINDVLDAEREACDHDFSDWVVCADCDLFVPPFNPEVAGAEADCPACGVTGEAAPRCPCCSAPSGDECPAWCKAETGEAAPEVHAPCPACGAETDHLTPWDDCEGCGISMSKAWLLTTSNDDDVKTWDVRHVIEVLEEYGPDDCTLLIDLRNCGGGTIEDYIRTTIAYLKDTLHHAREDVEDMVADAQEA